MLSSDIRYCEVNSKDTDSELYYDTDIKLTHLSSSDVSYIYNDSSVSSFCDSPVLNSLETVSDPSEETFIYNISSNEHSTENTQLSLENTFDTDCLETNKVQGRTESKYTGLVYCG